MLATQQTPETPRRSVLDTISSLIDASGEPSLNIETPSKQLLAQLRWHRVGLRLQQELSTQLAPEQRQQYARDCQTALARTAANIQSLRRIASCLDERGIRYLSLKGPTLSQLLYGSVLTKESADIDILVQPQDTLAAIDALQSIGFTSPETVPRNPRTWTTLQLLGKDWILHDSSNNCHAELHWRVEINPFLLPTRFDEWFQRKTCVNLGGVSVNTLSGEDMFIQVMVHGARSLWTRLHWLLDFDALLRRNDIDWQQASDAIIANGLQLIFLYSWQLSRQLLATPLPVQLTELIEKASKHQQSRAQKLADKSLWAMRQRRHLTWLPLRISYLDLKQEKKFLLFELATLIGPDQPDAMKLPLPTYLFPLYLLLRPWFIFERWLHKISKNAQKASTR